MGFIWGKEDLKRLVWHKNSLVRSWACERMKTFYGEAGLEVMERLLKDRDEDVLLGALDYIQAYPDPRFGDEILRLYKKNNGVVAGMAARALAQLKDERLVDAYDRKDFKIDSEEVFHTWMALGRLGTNPARERLRALLEEYSQDVDPIFIKAFLTALLTAKEDVTYILKFYSNYYKDFGSEIIGLITAYCASDYSLKDLDEEGKKGIFRTLPLAVERSLDYLKGHGFSSTEKRLRRLLRKGDTKEVIKVVAETAQAIFDEKRDEVGEESFSYWQKIESQPQINNQILMTLQEVIDLMPEDALKGLAIAAVVIFATVVEFKGLVGLNEGEISPQEVINILFEDRNKVRDDDRLMKWLLDTIDHDILFNSCINQLNKDLDSYGTIKAVSLLGSMKDERTIPHLVDTIKYDGNDDLKDALIEAIIHIGEPSVDSLGGVLDVADELYLHDILWVLKDIPTKETVQLLLKHWNKLISMDREVFIETIEGIASMDFMEPLKKEIREREELEEEAFYLLCHIHGVKDPILPEIERRMNERAKREASILKEDPMALLQESLRLELRCLICRRSYNYEVREVILDEEGRGNPEIMDRIVCKNCGVSNEYEITSKGHMAITGHLAFKIHLCEEGKADLQEGTIKIRRIGLTDGRLMSIGEGIRYYQKEIERFPEDPALRIGYANILMKKEEFEKAETQYNEAIKLDYMAIEAYTSLGDIAAKKGDISSAYEYFSQAAKWLHAGHYYRTKDREEFKDAVFQNLRFYREESGKERIVKSPQQQGHVKREKVGRNAPCPCGSGKKYKKCCLGKDKEERVEKTTATPAELNIRDQLISYSSKERFKGDFEKAYQLYWRRPFKEPLVLDEGEAEDFGFFLDWHIHDYLIEDKFTIVEDFYREGKKRLSEEEKRVLESEIKSYLSIYEVTSVTPEEGLGIRDLVTREEMYVVDVKGSLALVKWDVFIARAIRMGEVNKLSGIILIIPRMNKDRVLSSAKTLWEEFKKETGQGEWKDFMKARGYLLRHLYEDQPTTKKEIYTEEHHKVIFSKAIFDVKSFYGIQDRLDKELDFVIGKEEGGKDIKLNWLKKGSSREWTSEPIVERGVVIKSQYIEEGEGRWTILGTVTITPERLTLECVSKERLDRGKERLKKVLGEYIQHKLDTFEDMEKVMEKMDYKERVEKERVPSEASAPLLANYYEEHTLQWIDSPIHALDGKTPREAYKTLEGRERVEELLKDWENMEERKRRDGEDYIDVNLIREMLKD